MSLILEALRKSEAERRRGSSPDLLTPVVNVPPTTARAWPKWAVPAGLAAAVLVALGGIALWRMRDAAAPVAPTTVGPVEADRDAAAEPLKPAPPHAQSPTPATTASAVPPPASTSAPAMAQSAPAAAGHVAEGSEIEAPDAAQAATPPAPPSPVLPPPIAAPPRAAQAAPPIAPASSEFISPQATIRLAELSTEERSQLPALKVSMHMWAPASADRFVIIDGTRLAEGDRVADATIQAIQADGVTLAWRGRQIRLPIR